MRRSVGWRTRQAPQPIPLPAGAGRGRSLHPPRRHGTGAEEITVPFSPRGGAARRADEGRPPPPSGGGPRRPDRRPGPIRTDRIGPVGGGGSVRRPGPIRTGRGTEIRTGRGTEPPPTA